MLEVARKRLFRAGAVFLLVTAAIGSADPCRSVERIAPTPTGVGRLSDDMGAAAALLGDTAAVGAPGTFVGGAGSAGVVDIYRLQNGAWQEEAVLVAPVPAPNSLFGSVVAIGQDLLVAGDGGNLYTFARTGSTWQQVDEFPSAGFLHQIGLWGDTLVAGGSVFVRSGSAWQSQATLTADDDGLFESMAIDGDLVVGVSAKWVGLSSYSRDVYFYARSGDQWTREGKVPLGETLISTTVALAISGNTVLVGAPVSSFGPTASVRVFDRDSAGNWIDHGILDTGGPLSGALPVAIQGDVAVVGSPSDWTAYTFIRTNETWTRDQHFNDPLARCFAAVAVSESTLLAGCPYSFVPAVGYGVADFFSLAEVPPTRTANFGHGDARANESFGAKVAAGGSTVVATSDLASYFFDRTPTGWTQTNRFPAPPTHVAAGSVALDGNTAAIGYPLQMSGGTSEVDVYTRPAGNWVLQAVIPAPVSNDYPNFANTMALQGDLLVVGEQDASSSTCRVYKRTGTLWHPGPDLNPSPGAPNGNFCWSVAMSGDTLIVGAPGADMGLETNAGAAYVFVWTGTAWAQQTQLHAPLVAVGAGFGVSVAIKGDTAVVGSNSDFSPYSSTRGDVNVYRRSGNAWSWQATLVPAGASAPGNYGYAVAIADTEDRVVATAPWDFGLSPAHGVAYAFAFDGATWSSSTTFQASPPYGPPAGDWFGINAAFIGSEYVIGATADGDGGAVYVGPTSEGIFADGFDAAP